jgi:hypothetical protein
MIHWPADIIDSSLHCDFVTRTPYHSLSPGRGRAPLTPEIRIIVSLGRTTHPGRAPHCPRKSVVFAEVSRCVLIASTQGRERRSTFLSFSLSLLLPLSHPVASSISFKRKAKALKWLGRAFTGLPRLAEASQARKETESERVDTWVRIGTGARVREPRGGE